MRKAALVACGAAAFVGVQLVQIGEASALGKVPPPQPPMMPATPAAPNSLAVSGQYYDASVSGVRSLVESYRYEDPALYRKLDEKAGELEAMRTRSWVIGLGSVAVGAGAIITGFALYKPPPPDPPQMYAPDGTPLPSAPTPKADVTPILVGTLVGVPLILFSYFIGSAFGPGRTDYMDFVNYHNKVNPEHPLTWQVGLVPGREGPRVGGGLTLAF
jgi:hypothetical protein